MKLRPVNVLVAGVVFAVTPAFAAPQWVETACWRASQSGFAAHSMLGKGKPTLPTA